MPIGLTFGNKGTNIFMFKTVKSKTFTASAAILIASGLLLTGCSNTPAPDASSSSSSSKSAFEELENIADASVEKAAKNGFVENVDIEDTSYTLIYTVKGTEGKPQTAMKSYARAAINPDTGEMPSTADENGMETKYLLDRGYDNFDPIVIKKYLAGGSLFTNDGGSVVKNQDGTFTVKTPRQPDTIVTVKDGLIVGISQTFQPSSSVDGGTVEAQTLKSTIIYKLSEKELNIIEKAVETAKAEKLAADATADANNAEPAN